MVMPPPNEESPTALLRQWFATAIAVAQPHHCIPAYLPQPPQGQTVVVGAGKSAAAMAAAVEAGWPGPLTGVVVTRDGHGVPTRAIEVLEASHPVPDHRGAAAAERILATVAPLGPEDLVIALISGGGSALLTLPPLGLDLGDLIDINRQLLRCGADIGEMNRVRKMLSRSAGGRLAAAAYPAPVVTLAISDVPGDDLRAIASGPTVGDEVSAQEALAILDRYGVDISPAVREYLQRDPDPVIAPTDPRLALGRHHLIATPQQSLAAAAAAAAAQGYTPLMLGSALEGEARQVALVHRGIVQQICQYGQPVTAPCVVLSGGETTVTVAGAAGRGGRNSEFLLALAIALRGQAGVWAIAGDTDGIDGSETNAGAVIGPDFWPRCQALGLNPQDYLDRHDSYSLFAALGCLVETGPTLTNVNDFRAILIDPTSTLGSP